MSPPSWPAHRPPPDRRHRPGRRLVTLALLLTTAGAAYWFFVLREQTAPQSDFVKAATRYVDAGNAMLAAVDNAHTFIQVDDAASTVRASSTTMSDQVAVLQRLADNATGRSGELVQAALASAQNGITAGSDFYRAVVTNRITTADQEREKLESAIGQLQQAIEDWEQL